ncbi:PIR Superfamily Protein [Plasmodium ovale wallikeri]|uniref:PIR Superfamily Protein n=1 Tax=Plasmodium ovale wallikeri TaxID=864142 RepID=A0A1A9ARE6_PLAOA|nr:PIR Superfamily Protein [Plasmodium ovale wallikeri]
MATLQPQRALGTFFETYLSVLPSVQFYNDIKKDHADLLDYNKQCDDIIVKEKNEEVKKICRKYLRYLDKNFAVWNEVKNGHDICILMNYWIYNALTGIYGAENDSNHINVAFGNLQLVSSKLVVDSNKKAFYDRCKPNYDMFKYHDWGKRKKLYEYYVDYTTIKQQSEIFTEQCKDFYEYIEEKDSLYKHFQNLCISDHSSCPQFYNNCLPYNPTSVLPTIKCHEQIIAERATAEADAKPPDVQHFPGQERFSVPHRPDTVSTHEMSDIGTKVSHSVLGVAPVFLTATALYRYTPMGNWIRKLGGINPNNISDMDEFSSITQESVDMFSDNSVNYISYQPM